MNSEEEEGVQRRWRRRRAILSNEDQGTVSGFAESKKLRKLEISSLI